MKKLIISACLVAALTSCESFLDLKPIDFPTEETFYTDVKGLEGAVIGAYDELQSGDQYGSKFLLLMETRGDNITNNNSGGGGGVAYQIEVFNDTPANSNFSASWLSIYTSIYRCNLILQNAETVQMSDEQRTKIVGQASFIRALSYFNAVRLWGKIPLITKTQTVTEARNNKRADESVIYEQIIQDLGKAKALPKSWAAGERGRVTSYAASALLAKVYLYQKRYGDVVTELKPLVDAIHAGKDLSLVPMPQSFPNNLKTSKDIIFAAQYLKGGVGESVAENSRYNNNDSGNEITLPQSAFEDGDNRKAMVAPTGNAKRPEKFNAPAENKETSQDFPILRCAEVMLMYAEALNETTTAYPDAEAFAALNDVRNNAELGNKTVADCPTKDDFRKAVWNERRLELALECDRWFDIVRTGQFETVFPGVAVYRQIYPIPQTEIENVNDRTGWQNQGYSITD